jgi:hypothetical protein
MQLFLWRGHHSIRINGKVVSVPTHSMIAFFWGVLVTWNTDYLPSFFMFSLGWIMVVINQHVNNTPNRWHRVFGFFDALNFLVTGDMRGSRYAETPPNYRLAEIEAFNKAHDDREARIKREIELEKQYDLGKSADEMCCLQLGNARVTGFHELRLLHCTRNARNIRNSGE